MPTVGWPLIFDHLIFLEGQRGGRPSLSEGGGRYRAVGGLRRLRVSCASKYYGPEVPGMHAPSQLLRAAWRATQSAPPGDRLQPPTPPTPSERPSTRVHGSRTYHKRRARVWLKNTPRACTAARGRMPMPPQAATSPRHAPRATDRLQPPTRGQPRPCRRPWLRGPCAGPPRCPSQRASSPAWLKARENRRFEGDLRRARWRRAKHPTPNSPAPECVGAACASRWAGVGNGRRRQRGLAPLSTSWSQASSSGRRRGRGRRPRGRSTRSG